MYHVSAQGIDERMINVHYYYFHFVPLQMSSMNDPIGHTFLALNLNIIGHSHVGSLFINEGLEKPGP